MIRVATICAGLLVWGPQAQATTQYTEDVLLHVLIHEMGHALIREFDLPILANEEAMADEFATVFIAQTMPDRAGDIIAARVASWMIEADTESIFAEHTDDIRRAGRAVCLLYGLDPDRHMALARDTGMTQQEAAVCRDIAPEMARSWRRVLAPFMMPSNAPVTEVRIDPGPWDDLIVNDTLLETMYDVLAQFDWHSQITLQIAECDTGANWNRNGRQITLCNSLIDRFEDQAAQR